MIHLRRNILASIVVSAALVIGVVSPAHASGALPSASPTTEPVTAVPPLPTTKGTAPSPNGGAANTGVPSTGLVAATSPAPVTFSQQSGASSYNPITSVPISYGTNDTVFQNADGTETKEVSPTPINFQKPDGSWVPAGTSVTANLQTGGFSVADNPLNPTFAATTANGAGFSVNSGSDPVSISLEGAATVAATRPAASVLHSQEEGLGANSSATGSAIEYPGVFAGEDLQYQVAPSEVKETLVLDSVPSAAQTSWTWDIHAPGLTMSVSKFGSLYLTDANGVVQYNIPTPVMWDSSGVAGQSESVEVDVPYTYTQIADGDWLLTLTPSQSWLDDPSRVYPVSVDPTLGVDASSLEGFESNGTTETTLVNIGNSRAGGANTYWRTVACYPYNSLVQGDEITGGDLAYSYQTGYATTEPGDIYWASGFGYGDEYQYIDAWSVTNGSGNTTDSGIPNQYQTWDNEDGTGACLELSGNEVAEYTYKGIDTALYLNYEAAPTVVAASPSPTNGGRGPVMPTFAVTSNDISGATQNFTFSVSTNANPTTSPAWTGTTSGKTTASIQVPKGVLTAGTVYHWNVSVDDEYGAVRTTAAESFTANTPGVVSQSGTIPGDQSVVTTLTPTLTLPAAGTDANGDPLTYQFRVTTGLDGVSGQVVSSQWFPSTSTFPLSWTVPQGVLQDGTGYTWSVVVNDGYDSWDSWQNFIKIDLRVTDPGPAPTDTEGPVTVNLANGNVSTSVDSPTVSTVGGAMGEDFEYNSETASNAGLTGTYYSGIPTGGTSPVLTFPTTNPVTLQRTDSQVSFNWTTQPPAPGLTSNNFLAQWTGELTAPLGASSVYFGFTGSDTAKVFFNGSTTASATLSTPNTTTTPTMSTTAASLTAGPNSITVQYEDGTDQASIGLYVEYTLGGVVVGPELVPGTWFTKTVQTLPSGWAGSQALVGDQSNYVSAQNNGSTIVFTDVAGATHTYTLATGGGYTPPAGEQGVVSVASGTGIINLTDSDGTIYVFSAKGQLTSVTAATDVASKPAEPVPAYGSLGQLLSLTDPLSGTGSTIRQVLFTYATTSNIGSGGVCVPPTGFYAPPIGMLCEITYPDSSTTQLFYDTNGQLARVLNPGGSETDFHYTQIPLGQPLGGQYLLNWIRNPLANDWLAANTSVTPSALQETAITYTSLDQAASVTLPAPDGATAAEQPAKQYTYGTYTYGGVASSVPEDSDTGTTYVDEAGVTGAEADGHTGTVTFGAPLRELTSESPSGLTTTNTWDNADDLLTTVNPQGEESTTVYDSLYRPVASYGPAPYSCFTGQTPTSSTCTVGSSTITPAESTTAYDGGMPGLNTQFFNNTTGSGSPAAFALGVGSTGGTVNQTWTSAPATGVADTNFSLESTGLITFPTAGSYTLSLLSGGTSQLYINDVLIDSQTVAGSTTSNSFTATAGQVARLRISYVQLTGTAKLVLSWTPPGGTSAVVPGSQLSPEYDLATSNETYDSAPSGISGISSAQVPSQNVATTYGTSPWLGQIATSTVDPSGLDLVSSAGYESSTTLYDRPTSSTKPAGSATATTATYYPTTTGYGVATGTSTPVCGVPLSTPQYGMLELSATPDENYAYVYDIMGRVAGQTVLGDGTTACTSYDSRGRVSTLSYPAYTVGTVTSPARVVTYNYAVGGNPLESSISDSSGTEYSWVDLLGETTKYQDVQGSVTSTNYNQLGQVTSTTTNLPSSVTSGPTSETLTYQYNVDGQTTEELLNGNSVASLNYVNGLLSQSTSPTTVPAITYGNGTSLSTIDYALTGEVDGEAWSFTSGSQVSDDDVLSQSGRVLQDTITDGSTPYTSTYTYDAADRLTSATVPDNTLTYGFASSGGCGANTAAGSDGNRTSYSDLTTSGTGASATPAAVTFCYDNGDRLTSDNVAGTPANASPLLADNLVSASGPSQNLTYDSHGAITSIADQSLTYDYAGRTTSISTSNSGTSGPIDTVAYTYGPADELTSATTTIGSATPSTVDYSYTGGDMQFTLNGTNSSVSEVDISLPGGVIESIEGASQVWSYPDLRGDVTATTDGDGARTGNIAIYDPFGDPIDLTTGLIGTLAANQAVPNNTAVAGTSKGWAGSQLKAYSYIGDLAALALGARTFIPLLGRFLSVDPVPGGNSNDYNYPNDPVNSADLTGLSKGGASNGGPELSGAEEKAVYDKQHGLPYNKSAYNSAMQKIKEQEKRAGTRNANKQRTSKAPKKSAQDNDPTDDQQSKGDNSNSNTGDTSGGSTPSDDSGVPASDDGGAANGGGDESIGGIGEIKRFS